MARRLEGRAAFVTGAGQGVGRGIALCFAREGARVGVAEIDGDRARAVADEISALGGESFAIDCDVTDRVSVDAAIARAVEAFGGLHILVNNAQRAPITPVPLLEHNDEIVDLCFDTGFRGTLYCMQGAHPHMKAAGWGRIINIASGAGLDGMSGQGAYGATKEAIRAISKTAAREWAADGINVNILCPLARSPGVAQMLEAAPEMEAQITRGNPIARIGDCEEDIGPVALFLASDDSRYVTGHTLPADGGAVVLR
jgi:NAD(P)-dependent dehydrogenase (short-subunit alcohol dehydrogenase family)